MRGGVAVAVPANDPDVAILTGLAGMLRAQYIRPDVERLWAGSSFAWIRSQPSRRVGKIGEQLVSGWCAAKGLDVTSTGDSEADRVINHRRTEIKFSTLWESGTYTFQQIRDQDYDHVVCLGISPHAAHCWAVPKAIVRGNIAPQHGGRVGRDTAWFKVNPDHPQAWLQPYGGTLAQAFRIISAW
jgi:hypothetical protein